MYMVYILYSNDFDKYYVGMCTDIERRLQQHNAGASKSTKAFRPWKLIYSEVYESRQEARKREKYLKSGAGREWRARNIHGH